MKLLSPIQLGSLTVRNRIVMPAMHMNFTPEGVVNDQFIEFYRKRAEGGVGLITIGGCPVDPHAGGTFMLGINDDKYIPGMQRFTKAMHEHGAACALQLYHAGRYTYSFFLNGEQAPSASETFCKLTREKSREMSKEEIQKTIEDFAVNAERVKKCGFDAVEIICSAGYLINQFLSPLTNHRSDEYGGSLENRMRFGIEVIRAVRDACGKDYPILIRLSGNDFVAESNTNKENALFAKALEEEGVAFFNVTGGWHESNIPQITNALPTGGYSYLARNVKRLVKVPVAAANRIHHPDNAEALLQEGWADMISMGRPLITDPKLVTKLVEGRQKDVIHCISCNQKCLDYVFEMKTIGCLMNPEVGRELETIQAAETKKNVLIVGGGPAGLAAAHSAARRGHTVTLVEKEARLGGQLHYAGIAPGKDEFLSATKSLARRAERAGATLKLNVTADKALLEKEKPDVLIVATGSVPARPPIPGLDKPKVLGWKDVMDHPDQVGERVVVVGAGPIGVEIGLLLAEIGTIDPAVAAFLLKHDAEKPEVIRDLLWHGNKTITLLEMAPRAGSGIGRSTRWVHLKELQESGVTIQTKAKVLEITDTEVVCEQGEERVSIPYDTVVLATGMVPGESGKTLAEAFDGEVHLVGDAVKIGDAASAIEGGYLLGLDI